MSLIDDLELRINEDHLGSMVFQITPEFEVIDPATGSRQTIKPFNVKLVQNFKSNYQLIAVPIINPGNEIYLLPQVILSIVKDIKQGKMGKGNFLIEGDDFSTKSLVFTQQVQVYCDKANFDVEVVKKEFEKIGLRLIVKEFEANYKLEKRHALIIGNSVYKNHGVLRNAGNDAISMESVLTSLGFETKMFIDLSQSEMKETIDAFSDQMDDADVGLFYYAGHGLEYQGVNYLVPTDVHIKRKKQIEFDCVRLDRVLKMLDKQRTKCNILILDSCRTDPFTIDRGFSVSGLKSIVEVPKGWFISFATSPNDVADDGEGDNGLFTTYILKHIKTPGIGIEELFKRVRKDVESKSEGEQITWQTSTMVGDFYFKR